MISLTLLAMPLKTGRPALGEAPIHTTRTISGISMIFGVFTVTAALFIRRGAAQCGLTIP